MSEAQRREYWAAASQRWRDKHPDRSAQARRRSYARYRRIALRRIAGDGPVACVRCGCDDERVLEVNHKAGGGNEEAARTPGGMMGILVAVALGKRTTEDLELLCRGCNAIHSIELRFPDLISKFQIIWQSRSRYGLEVPIPINNPYENGSTI
jgi:5-methylcytosine-specific restriction endonuclease McrA